MKMLYGMLALSASISGLCAMDDSKNNITKQTAGISLSNGFKAIASSSTPELPTIASMVSPRASSSSNILGSPRTPRVPSPVPQQEMATKLAKYSERRASVSSLSTIVEKK